MSLRASSFAYIFSDLLLATKVKSRAPARIKINPPPIGKILAKENPVFLASGVGVAAEGDADSEAVPRMEAGRLGVLAEVCLLAGAVRALVGVGVVVEVGVGVEVGVLVGVGVRVGVGVGADVGVGVGVAVGVLILKEVSLDQV